MQRRQKILAAKCAAILSAFPFLICAYEYGPDAGYVDVPGELGNCTASGCHSDHPVNSGAGSVTVTFPNGLTYTPGVTQHLVVTISDPDPTEIRWGFELTARTSDPKTMAGSFNPTDSHTQVLCSSTNFISQANATSAGCAARLPLAYVEHTLAGYSFVQPNRGTYEFDWLPPATDVGPITIYVAGNAGPGNLNDPGGCHIYTATYTLTTGAVATLPTITAVVNAAGGQSGITQQSWVAIQGSNLSSTSGRLWNSADFVNGKVPTQLDDVSVSINGNPAAIEFTSPGQINVWSPADSSLGPVNVTVTNANGASTPFSATLQNFSPAFFLWTGKYAVATDSASGAWIGPLGMLGLAIPTVPAKPGATITLVGTGFGATNPPAPPNTPVPTGVPLNLVTLPNVRVGGAAAQVLGGALVPGSVGSYQIKVKLPASLPDGDQKLQVDIGGISGPDGVFLTIHQ